MYTTSLQNVKIKMVNNFFSTQIVKILFHISQNYYLFNIIRFFIIYFVKPRKKLFVKLSGNRKIKQIVNTINKNHSPVYFGIIDNNQDILHFLQVLYSLGIINCNFHTKSRNDYYDSRFGITFFGYFFNIFGLAKMARLLFDALLYTKFPLTLFPIVSYSHQFIDIKEHSFSNMMCYFQKKKLNKINIFMINADTIQNVVHSIGKRKSYNNYNIGCWFWEIETDFPFEDAIAYVDEIWGFSDFCCDIFRSFTTKPVTKITYPFQPTWKKLNDPVGTRRILNIGLDDTVFFFNFDFHSCFERKNPLGIIKAFKTAFSHSSTSVRLIIKSIHAEYYPIERNLLNNEVIKDYRIIWINSSMNEDDYFSLLHASDCYISLHRSEGLGMGIAEAMYLGKCVIATAYGGSMEFLNSENSMLVPYKLIKNKKDFEVYRAGYYWADPNIEIAASHMKKITMDLSYRDLLSQKGKKFIKTHYTPEKCAQDITKRIREIEN